MKRQFLVWEVISTWQVIKEQIEISPWIHYSLPFAYSFLRAERFFGRVCGRGGDEGVGGVEGGQ